MRGYDDQGWAGIDRRYWIDITTYYDRPGVFKPEFQDFYFPQNSTANSSSYSVAYDAWMKEYSMSRTFGSSVGPSIMSALSMVHRGVIATGSSNLEVLRQYIQNNVFTTMFGRFSFNYAGVLAGVDRMLTQIGETPSLLRTVFPPEYADTPLIWPMPVGCPLPPPSSSSVCDRITLKWTSSSISLGGNGAGSSAPNSAPSTVVITSPLLVNGNVTIGQGTIVLNEGGTATSGRTLEPAVINSTGCISINGGVLQLPFTLVDSASTRNLDTRTLVISQSGCLSGQFDLITVVTQNVTDPCLNVTAIPAYTAEQLSVLFSVTSNRCSSEAAVATWIIAVAVVVPVVAIIAIIAVLMAIPATRRRMAPGWEFRRRIGSVHSSPTQ
jgi:hypothetical protein